MRFFKKTFHLSIFAWRATTPHIVVSGPVLEYGAIGGIVVGVDRFENNRDNSRDQIRTSRRADLHVSRRGANALQSVPIDGSGPGPQNVGSRIFYFALKR